MFYELFQSEWDIYKYTPRLLACSSATTSNSIYSITQSQLLLYHDKILLQQARILRMTSYFARHRALRPDTHYAYAGFNTSIDYRVQFYVLYFRDIVPRGVTVHRTWRASLDSQTQEIQLRTPSGSIFMYGLVTQSHNANQAEDATRRMARQYFMHGHYADDDDCWRYFTASIYLSLHNGYIDNEQEWHERVDSSYPILQAESQAWDLQNQYDSMASH